MQGQRCASGFSVVLNQRKLHSRGAGLTSQYPMLARNSAAPYLEIRASLAFLYLPIPHREDKPHHVTYNTMPREVVLSLKAEVIYHGPVSQAARHVP